MTVARSPRRPSPARRAVLDSVSVFLPAVPFGFVVGLAATESAMPTAIAYLTSLIMFAGAAQLVLITLAGTATLWAAASAALVINARHLMYSAALSPAFRHQPRWFRWVGPFVLIDQVFALTSLRSLDDPDEFRRYYLTVGACFFVGWQLCVALGLVVGPVIPVSWQLGFAPAVMFCGMVAVSLRDRPSVVAAVVGAGVSAATLGLENRLGLLVGGLAGVVAATLVEQIGAAGESGDASAGVGA
jgi:predicted branched-subunit amino acid permease